MGSGALFSIYRGRNDSSSLRSGILHAFILLLSITVLINAAVYAFMEPILLFLRVPDAVRGGMREYLAIIYVGLIATSLYNYVSCLLRALGNSSVPLIFLAISAVLNIALDLIFVLVFSWGIAGVAWATVIAQYISAVGLCLYVLFKCPELIPKHGDMRFSKPILKDIFSLSSLTCLQQSVMNFGILMVQGIVNSFGTKIMAAFAVSVKIDTIAYMPVQDFGNAFSTFIAQNFGAGKYDRIKDGIKKALKRVVLFCIFISAIVFIFAKPLMMIFVNAESTEIINIGVQYLRIEGACYIGIGILFMLYGYYRAINKPSMSVVLTVISLGIRVVLAYVLSHVIGAVGIWWSIPIGWFIADAVGICFYLFKFDR